jgi:uncharacterized membrane protein
MSQQYPPGGGPPPGQEPDYSQPDYNSRPTQYIQQPPGPYGQQSPYDQQQPYGQPQYPQQPPYGQHPSYPPYQQQQPYVVPIPAQVVEAAAFERSLSLLVYIWAIMFTVLVGGSVLEFRNDYKFQFIIHLVPLAGLLLPLVASSVVKTGQLAIFHARQALYLGALYFVARFAIGLLYLIPETTADSTVTVRSILIEGILIGALEIVFIWLALTGAVRAFYNRELYRLPVVGGMVK